VLGALVANTVLRSIGIDVELIQTKSIAQIETLVAAEGRAPGTERDVGTLQTLSVKEAVFKAQYPITSEVLDFAAIQLEWNALTDLSYSGVSHVPHCPNLQFRATTVGQWILSVAYVII